MSLRLPDILVPRPSQRLLDDRRYRLAVLVAGVLIILIWQTSMQVFSPLLDQTHRLRASSGVQAQRKFLYFLRNLDLYPVATLRPDELLQPGREAAVEEAREYGEQLVTEYAWTNRYGEPGKVQLLRFDAWLKGDPHNRNVSYRTANRLYFTLALVMVFVSFTWRGYLLLGGLLVLFMGSNPFQLFEVYVHDNVFSYAISTAMIALALHFPLLLEKPPAGWYLASVPVITGALLATIRLVRTEPVVMLASAAAAYLFLARSSWKVKVALVTLLLGSFLAFSWGWKSYFAYKLAEAESFVRTHGGEPYEGPRDQHHVIWHPVWCGLGDFGTDKGYHWDDRVAARYVLPILRERYGMQVPTDTGESYVLPGYFFDRRGVYPTLPLDLPHFREVEREKVLHDVAADPAWYLGILAQRAGRLLSRTSPVRVTAAGFHLTLPLTGWLLLPIAGLLAWHRCWMPLKLILFLVPTSLTALLIFCDKGTWYYSTYHLAIAALLGTWLAALVRRRGRPEDSTGEVAREPV